jgi:hypothetical protein
MPVWLRIFTFNKLKDHYDKINNPENPQENSDAKNIHKPNIIPKSDYTTKILKK